MARASTASDVFNAVAEPRRRDIVALLADGQQRSVGQLVIKQVGNKTQINFSQDGLVPDYECYEICNNGCG